MTVVPDLKELRRWERAVARQRRRMAHSVMHDLSDWYSLVLGAAMWSLMLFHSIRLHDVEAVGSPTAASMSPVPLTPLWTAVCGAVTIAGAATGATRRLGPLSLQREEVYWLLPRPGSRDGLMRVLARRLLAGGALGAVALSVLVGWLVGAGPETTFGTTMVVVPTIMLGLILTIHAQLMGRGAGAPRLFMFSTAVMALLCAMTDMPEPDIHIAGGASLLVTVCTILIWRTVTPLLGELSDAALAEPTKRIDRLRAHSLMLDTRGLCAAMAPPLRLPKRSANLRFTQSITANLRTRRSPLFGARRRTVVGVAQADFLLLQRQPWRWMITVLLALAAGAVVLPLHTGLRLLLLPALAWTACLVCGDAVRRAQRHGSGVHLWPAAGTWARVGHLVVPALVMLCWWGVVGLVIHASARVLGVEHGAQAPVALLGLLAAPGWAGVTLRSGFRSDAEWSVAMPTPFGMLVPVGLVQTLTAGPDAAAVVATPMIIAQTGAVTPALCVAQLCASALTVVWGLRTGRSAYA